MPSQVSMGLIARLRLSPRVGVELMGFIPLSTPHLSGGDGSTRVSTWLGGAGLFARQPLGAHAGIEAGGGVLGALVRTVGTVATGVSDVGGFTDWSRGGSVYGRLGANLALSRVLALRLDLMGGVAFHQADSKPDSTMDSQARLTWGRTFAAALGGVEARWF
jgi:hypothetical protein